MKKRTKDLYCSLGPVKLYADDLHKIVGAFSELSDNVEVTIKVDEYETSSLEELSELEQRSSRNLIIDCLGSENQIFHSIKLGVVDDRVSLFASEDTAVSRGIFEKVKAILTSRQRWWNWVATLFTRVAPLSAVIVILLVWGEIRGWKALTYAGLAMGAISFVLLVLFLATIKARKSEIVFTNRFESTTFWQRNKDSIAINAIGFILGVLSTLFVQLTIRTLGW